MKQRGKKGESYFFGGVKRNALCTSVHVFPRFEKEYSLHYLFISRLYVEYVSGAENNPEIIDLQMGGEVLADITAMMPSVASYDYDSTCPDVSSSNR